MIQYEAFYVVTANGWFTDLRDNLLGTMSRIPGRWRIAEAIAMLERSRRFGL